MLLLLGACRLTFKDMIANFLVEGNVVSTASFLVVGILLCCCCVRLCAQHAPDPCDVTTGRGVEAESASTPPACSSALLGVLRTQPDPWGPFILRAESGGLAVRFGFGFRRGFIDDEGRGALPVHRCGSLYGGPPLVNGSWHVPNNNNSKS